jgi:hypothetical protein
VPRHYAKRPFSCWCHACSRVQGCGLVSQLSGPDLLVSDCTRSNQTAWTEDQFTVTSSAGIRNREKRAADTVTRELKRAKPGAWACIQARKVWSTEKEANMRPGHFWICKLGTVPGSMSCVDQKFDLQAASASGRSTRAPGTPTGTTPSSLMCGCIGLLMTRQDSRFRSGTPQRVLTTQVFRWQCSSTRASCVPRTSTSWK